MARTRKNNSPATKNPSLAVKLAEAQKLLEKQRASDAAARERLAQKAEREYKPDTIVAGQAEALAYLQAQAEPKSEAKASLDDLAVEAEGVILTLEQAAKRLAKDWEAYKAPALQLSLKRERREALPRLGRQRSERVEVALSAAMTNAERNWAPRNGQLTLAEAVANAQSWDEAAWVAGEASALSAEIDEAEQRLIGLKREFDTAKAQLDHLRTRGFSLLGVFTANDGEELAWRLKEALRRTQYEVTVSDLTWAVGQERAMAEVQREEDAKSLPAVEVNDSTMASLRDKPSSKLRRMVARWEADRKGSQVAYEAAKAILLERDKA